MLQYVGKYTELTDAKAIVYKQRYKVKPHHECKGRPERDRGLVVSTDTLSKSSQAKAVVATERNKRLQHCYLAT